MDEEHPVRFSVDYPDRPLNRLTTALRIFTVIPIVIVLGSIGGYAGQGGYDAAGEATPIVIGGTGLLVLPLLLMILFRQKYPRWWYDWNLELMRFTNRVATYFALMSDRYPSTDEHQWVRLDFPYPDARHDLNRWLPLVKWLLAIPHLILVGLFVGGWGWAWGPGDEWGSWGGLGIAGLVGLLVVIACIILLFTGRYPPALFDFAVGLDRWALRVAAYVGLMTDDYPPFRLDMGPHEPGAERESASAAAT